MVAIETISIVFTGLSISLAAFYYISVLRNTQRNQQLQLETRQAQFLMNLYEGYRSPIFRQQFDHVMFRMDYEDWDEFNKKFDPIENLEERVIWFSVASFYEGIGVLLKHKLIDISLIDDLIGPSAKMAWEKIGPFEIESRKRLKQPRAWDDFEFLYNELVKYHEKHPELKN